MLSATKTGLRALTVLAFAASAVSATPLVATADTPAPVTGPHQIKTFANKCLDVWGGHANDGTGIIQYTCWGHDNQTFTIKPVDGQPDEYEIHTFADNKCLDVWDARSDNGTGIIEYGCNNGANQHFKIVPFGSKVMIRTFYDKCLDVWDASTSDGTGIIQYDCTGQNNQMFTLA
ncbi:RICIN domain-containing protein [Kitasatospora sp. MAP5-34]|uniref:RICIN domain-containing protein n=1 Tax=Kitasatospora sp. MAP5-34 TaxID=3035102 RepID=UPI0024760B55|nr:RICIN domain-containing protein [Kitasatospora sp. MAP5-34]MDH6580271.1 hypothetical protein [Kitasatospora sp. MAP5-34]